MQIIPTHKDSNDSPIVNYLEKQNKNKLEKIQFEQWLNWSIIRQHKWNQLKINHHGENAEDPGK